MDKWHLESPLFSALTDEERRSISAGMRSETYHKGESITVENAPSESIYFVESGWVRIFSEQGGRKVILANLGPGSSLGEVELLLDQCYSTTAEAASDVELRCLTKSHLQEVIAREPSIGIRLSTALGSKVVQMTQYLAEYRLPQIPFFAQLSEESLLGLAERLQVEVCERGDTICWLGELGEAMYVIESGDVDVVLAPESDEVPSPLTECDLLGEMALLANKPHAATCRATSDVVLWSLSRADFDELVSRYPGVRQALSRALSEHLSPEDRAMAEQRLETIPLFGDLPPEVTSGVAQRLVLQHYPRGELVFSEGDVGDSLYIIEMGEVKLATETAAGESTVAWLEAGEFFGEMALLTGKTRSVKARAMTDTNLWVLYKNDYDELMVDHPSLSVALGKVLSQRLTEGFREDRPRATITRMREMPLLAQLTESELADVIRRLRPVEREAGHVLFSQGEAGETMYFIESGQVEVQARAGEGRTILSVLGAGEPVGEMALLSGKPRTATARAVTDVQLWALEKADFDELTLKYPRFALAISRALSERLEAASAVEAALAKPGKAVRVKAVAGPKREPTIPPVVADLTSNLQVLGTWLAARRTGVKLRLAVVGFLLLWLCGISFPATVISSVPLERNDLMAVFETPLPTETPAVEVPAAALVERMVATDTAIPTETSVPATPTEEGVGETAMNLALVPTETATPVPPTLTPTQVPPTATRPAPTPTSPPVEAGSVMGTARGAPEVRVLDRYGMARDLAWAQHYYGTWIEFSQPGGGACYRIVELRERSGPSNIDVTVLDQNGDPMPNVMLYFDWPGGEVQQATNGEGKVGFALGPGSYIYDREVGGPHSIRVLSDYPSDVARNCGMLAGTPHDHLDIVMQLVRTGP